uniref:DC1 domain-containing protein n=1 Tax=Oryza brachyantha TaxID=4533 RepID=J3MUT5_ORYBR
MGGSYSHSHSHSHPAQPCNHALKRAGCGNLGGAACGLCGKQKATDPSHGHQLVLRASETGAGGGRRCVRCNKIAAGPAWSYQCPTCRDVGFCLRCVLGKDDDRPQCCCACGAAPAGFAMGIFLRGLLRGFTGL